MTSSKVSGYFHSQSSCAYKVKWSATNIFCNQQNVHTNIKRLCSSRKCKSQPSTTGKVFNITTKHKRAPLNFVCLVS